MSSGLSGLIAAICNENDIVVMTWKEFYVEYGAELIKRMNEDGYHTDGLSRDVLKLCVYAYFPKILIQ